MAYWGDFDWRHPAHFQTGHRRVYQLVAAGGALLAVSTILPWLQPGFGGRLDLFELHRAEHLYPYMPIAMAAAGGLLFFASYFGAPARLLGWSAMAAGAAAVVAGGGDFVYVWRRLGPAAGFMSIGIGTLVAIGGVVCLILAFTHVRRYTPAPARPTRRPRRPRRRKGASAVAEVPADPSPGWKPDPWGVGRSRRYWDGQSWTSETSQRPF